MAPTGARWGNCPPRPPDLADDNPLGVTEEMLVEQAFLISRGVRPMALVARIGKVPTNMHYAFMCLGRVASRVGGRALPFVIDSGDALADCGFASEAWVIELYRFAITNKDVKPYEHQVVGLLLGYNAASIAWHEDRDFGAMFHTRTGG